MLSSGRRASLKFVLQEAFDIVLNSRKSLIDFNYDENVLPFLVGEICMNEMRTLGGYKSQAMTDLHSGFYKMQEIESFVRLNIVLVILMQRKLDPT